MEILLDAFKTINIKVGIVGIIIDIIIINLSFVFFSKE